MRLISSLRAASVAALLAAPFMATSVAQAAGGSLLAPGTAIVPMTATGTLGTLLASNSQDFFVDGASSDIQGTLRTAVFQDADGTLDFVLQVTNTAPTAVGFGSFGRLTTGNFASFLTSVGFFTNDADGAGLFTAGLESPDFADRGADGEVIGFDFLATGGGKIAPGETSSILVISTNATNFAAGDTSVINGVAFSGRGFRPVAPNNVIPEPGTMALLATGLLPMAGAIIRRRRSN